MVLLAVPLAFALAKLLLHLVTSQGYGYFRDELYYLACADHLAWGYVDHPPLSIALLAGTRALLGDSLLALRLVPALAGAATVLVTGLITRELGGGRLAQALSCAAALAAPIYLALDHYYSMNALDLLFWSVAVLLLVRILRAERPAPWWLLGVVLGLGLLNKLSILWLGAGVVMGLLLTRHRALLLTRGPWLAAGIAAVLFLPHVAWQIRSGWPTLEFMHNATTVKMAPMNLLGFATDQLRVMNPAAAPLWLGGLVFSFTPAGARWRPLGIQFLTVVVILVAGGSARASYLAGAYPGLLGLGAVAAERLLDRARWHSLRPALAYVLPALVLAVGATPAPLAIPILPVETFLRYANFLGRKPASEERKAVGPLPPFYADMFGWPELANAVADVYEGLSADERRRCNIYGQNYGQAGAIDLFGRRRGLPGATAGHNNYFLWGPGPRSGDPSIIIGGRAEDHRRAFQQVEQVTVVSCPYCMPYERDRPLFVARGLKRPLRQIWPRVKHYD